MVAGGYCLAVMISEASFHRASCQKRTEIENLNTQWALFRGRFLQWTFILKFLEAHLRFYVVAI